MAKKSKKINVKGKVTVEVQPVSEDGSRTILIKNEGAVVKSVVLDSNTASIAREYLDKKAKIYLYGHGQGYLTHHCGPQLHKYIMDNQPNANAIYKAAVLKWGTRDLVVAHLDGDSLNVNLSNLAYLPEKLNLVMKKCMPMQRGKSFIAKVTVQGVSRSTPSVKSKTLCQVLIDGLKLRLSIEYCMTLKFGRLTLDDEQEGIILIGDDNDWNDNFVRLTPEDEGRERVRVANNWSELLFDRSMLGRIPEFDERYNDVATLLEFCSTHKKKWELSDEAKEKLREARKPENVYESFNSITAIEKKLGRNNDLLVDIKKAISRLSFNRKTECIVYYRGSASGKEYVFLCDKDYFEEIQTKNCPTIACGTYGYLQYGGFPIVYMHVDILKRYGAKYKDGCVIDHWTNVSVDNRKRNLTVVSSSANASNREGAVGFRDDGNGNASIRIKFMTKVYYLCGYTPTTGAAGYEYLQKHYTKLETVFKEGKLTEKDVQSYLQELPFLKTLKESKGEENDICSEISDDMEDDICSEISDDMEDDICSEISDDDDMEDAMKPDDDERKPSSDMKPDDDERKPSGDIPVEADDTDDEKENIRPAGKRLCRLRDSRN